VLHKFVTHPRHARGTSTKKTKKQKPEEITTKYTINLGYQNTNNHASEIL